MDNPKEERLANDRMGREDKVIQPRHPQVLKGPARGQSSMVSVWRTARLRRDIHHFGPRAWATWRPTTVTS